MDGDAVAGGGFGRVAACGFGEQPHAGVGTRVAGDGRTPSYGVLRPWFRDVGARVDQIGLLA